MAQTARKPHPNAKAFGAPILYGYDPSKQGADRIAYFFVCADCGTVENSAEQITPAGWDVFWINHIPNIRCPDCLEAIEQRQFAAHSQ